MAYLNNRDIRCGLFVDITFNDECINRILSLNGITITEKQPAFDEYLKSIFMNFLEGPETSEISSMSGVEYLIAMIKRGPCCFHENRPIIELNGVSGYFIPIINLPLITNIVVNINYYMNFFVPEGDILFMNDTIKNDYYNRLSNNIVSYINEEYEENLSEIQDVIYNFADDKRNFDRETGIIYIDYNNEENEPHDTILDNLMTERTINTLSDIDKTSFNELIEKIRTSFENVDKSLVQSDMCNIMEFLENKINTGSYIEICNTLKSLFDILP
jgi:hypothetical protein